MRFIIWSTFFPNAIKRRTTSQLVKWHCGQKRYNHRLCWFSSSTLWTTTLEIGYTLHPNYWGLGYVPGGGTALIDLSFKELDLHEDWTTCLGIPFKVNELQRATWLYLEARIRGRTDVQGNRDSLIYGLLRSESGKFIMKKRWIMAKKKVNTDLWVHELFKKQESVKISMRREVMLKRLMKH